MDLVKTLRIVHVVEEMPKKQDETNGVMYYQAIVQTQVARKVLDEEKLMMATLGERILLSTC